MDPNKQIRYSNYQISDSVQHGGLMDSQQCSQLAQQVMKLYDADNDGYIDTIEIGFMISDCYRAMNKGFNPTPTDVSSYARVLDQNGNGRVHLADIEKLCLRYFGGAAKNTEIHLDSEQTTVTSKPKAAEPLKLKSKAPAEPTQLSNAKKNEAPIKALPTKLNRNSQERLAVARRIFKKVDSDNSGFITSDEKVPELLRETYKQIGMKFEPTQEDVKIWFAMTDTNGDGMVNIEEYEGLVLRSLQQQGIVLD